MNQLNNIVEELITMSSKPLVTPSLEALGLPGHDTDYYLTRWRATAFHRRGE